MPTYVPPKKNTEYIFYLSLVSQADTKLFQVNPTLAAGDAKVSIDGVGDANLTTLPAVTPAGSKRVKITLSAAEMNGDNITVTLSDAAGAQWCDVTINIQTAAQQLDDVATQVSVTAVDDLLDTEIAAIKAKTDNLPAAPAATGDAMTLTAGERNSIADATLDRANGVETGLTPRGALRLIAAAEAGKTSGMETATAVIRAAVSDSKVRITATTDADGNRSAVTTDST